MVVLAAKSVKQDLSEWIRDALRTAAEKQMYRRTLHEAMRIVLAERTERAATTSELAEEIERRGLYARRDGKRARAQQINARARKYPNLFTVEGSGLVRLLTTGSADVGSAESKRICESMRRYYDSLDDTEQAENRAWGRAGL